MTDKVTPIRKTITPGDVIKGQMVDTFGDCYECLQQAEGAPPVAMLVVMVGPTGGASTQWFVSGDHEHQTSLYLARALQIAHIDLHNHQQRLTDHHG